MCSSSIQPGMYQIITNPSWINMNLREPFKDWYTGNLSVDETFKTESIPQNNVFKSQNMEGSKHSVKQK